MSQERCMCTLHSPSDNYIIDIMLGWQYWVQTTEVDPVFVEAQSVKCKGMALALVGRREGVISTTSEDHSEAR